ncbi:MAG: hypothetical protein AAGG48_14250 [Planctomycetota bacterium]
MSNSTVQQAVKPKSSKSSATASDIEAARLAKLQERRIKWQWNGRLLAVSVMTIVVVGVVSVFSYRHFSASTAETFLARASSAEQTESYGEQLKWLRRYSLMRPDDDGVLIPMAMAAESATDNAKPDKLISALNTSRKQLGSALAKLDADAPEAQGLRYRLVQRLLQLGGAWYREAERQVGLLGVPVGDARATKLLAMALVGQVNAGTYVPRSPSPDARKRMSDWELLATQPVGDVLLAAADANPGDLDCVSAIVAALDEEPDFFSLNIEGSDAGDSSTGDIAPALVAKVAQVIEVLRGTEDSRSRLILNRFDLRFGDGIEARANLKAAGFHAFENLMALDESSIPQTLPGVYASVPNYYWDYQLLLEASREFAAEEPEAVDLWYERLAALRLPLIPSSDVEQAYLGAGLLHEINGDPRRAIEMWSEGLESVNGASVDLMLAIARVRKEDNHELADFRKSVEDLAKAIDMQSRLLALSNDRQLARERQDEMYRRISAAKWRLLVLQSTVSERSGERRAAIDGLEKSIDTGAELVPDEERLRAAIELAALYRLENEWDQSAAILERATQLAPDNLVLRAETARAWTRAGNRLNAIKQWRLVGTSKRFDLQISAAEALFNYQIRLPRKERDFSGVRSSVRRLEAALVKEEQKGTNIGDARRPLALLKVSLPPEGTSVEEHLRSKQLADAVDKLSLEFPSNQEIQAFAAERLAVSGQDEKSQLAIQRLQESAGEDSTIAIIVKSRIASAAGRHEEAARQVIDCALADEDRRFELLELAASFAIMGSLPELAYEAIASIPQHARTADILYKLANLARAIPSESSILRKEDKSTPLELSVYWESELKALEGRANGTLWRYLHASRLVDELERETTPIRFDDERLKEARRLVEKIESIRPRWGQAIALKGWIHAIDGDSSKAVFEIQRGIAAGDKSIRTRQRLWTQLLLLNRFDEARSELDSAALSADFEVDSYSAFRIALAKMEGNYQQSVDVAKNEIEKRPEDFLAYLVYARTSSYAAKQVTESLKREEFVKAAREAVESARELAQKDETSIFFTGLAVEIDHGGKDGVRREIARIRESGLPDAERFALLARAFEAIGELDRALDWIVKSDRLRSTSQTQLAIANLNRKLRDSSGEIDALRRAVNNSPKDGQLRNRLAQAIVARDGDEVDWDEVAKLLTTSPDVTWGNRLLYSLLLLKQGDEAKTLRAEQILREIQREQNRFSDDANRVLAGVLTDRAGKLDDDQESLRERCVAEVRSIYEDLVREQDAPISDLFRFADFLIELDDEGDQLRIDRLYERINTHPQGALAAFQIKIQLDKKDGKDLTETARQFVLSRQQELGQPTAASIAGAFLMQLGLQQHGLDWLKQAYESDPAKLPAYIAAMNKAEMFDKSARIASSHFETHGDVEAAVLLVEALFKASSIELSNEYENVIASALMKHGDHVPLLESLATLRLRNEDYLNAIAMYQRILEIDSTRLLTLNNLAMAYTELPGRAAEGIEPIDRAIRLAGELPELLDTKGVVLLKAGRAVDAEGVFQQALTAIDEPRFGFHLIMSLLAQDKQSEARKRWMSLDLERLNIDGLVESERELLETLKIKFESNTL